MFNLRYYLLVFCILTCQPAAAGDTRSDASVSPDSQVRRNYLNTSQYLISGHALALEGSPRQIMRLSGWLDEIVATPIGRETLDAILNSGNRLTIRHSEWALPAAGRTLAPVSDNLTNGHGMDVEILFDVRIPDHGSHYVYDTQYRAIEFTAVQNLLHELAHAKHLVNGTWRYFDSEGQAIEEENMFRRQFAELHGLNPVSLRGSMDGEQFWWPDRHHLAVSQ